MVELTENLLPNSGGVAVDPLGEPARERLRRGRKAKTSVAGSGVAGSTGVDTASADAEKIAELQALQEELYRPEGWYRVATFPLDVAQLITGDDAFEASEQERQTLGGDIALTLKFWTGIDPKWLVLGRFASNLLSIYGSHWLVYKTKMLEKKLKESNG